VVEPEPIVYRDEVVAMLFAIADIRLSLATIVGFIGGDDGEEEATPDDF
jgi:hypothetical protein